MTYIFVPHQTPKLILYCKDSTTTGFIRDNMFYTLNIIVFFSSTLFHSYHHIFCTIWPYFPIALHFTLVVLKNILCLVCNICYSLKNILCLVCNIRYSMYCICIVLSAIYESIMLLFCISLVLLPMSCLFFYIFSDLPRILWLLYVLFAT